MTRPSCPLRYACCGPDCKWFVGVDDPSMADRCTIEIIAESLGSISRRLAEDDHVASELGEVITRRFYMIEKDISDLKSRPKSERKMTEKPVFKIEACCLICARGEPDNGTVLCTEDQCSGYIETHYCERFMLRDLGYDVEQV